MAPCSSSPVIGTNSVLHSVNSLPSGSNLSQSNRYPKKGHIFKSENQEACGQVTSYLTIIHIDYDRLI